MAKVLDHRIEYCDGEYRIIVKGGDPLGITQDYCELTISAGSDELDVSMKIAGLHLRALEELGRKLVEAAVKIREMSGE